MSFSQFRWVWGWFDTFQPVSVMWGRLWMIRSRFVCNGGCVGVSQPVWMTGRLRLFLFCQFSWVSGWFDTFQPVSVLWRIPSASFGDVRSILEDSKPVPVCWGLCWWLSARLESLDDWLPEAVSVSFTAASSDGFLAGLTSFSQFRCC